MEFLTTKTLNLMLIMDSFEHVRPLNFKPKTPREIQAKASSQDTITDDRKGNIFFLNKKRFKIQIYYQKIVNNFFLKNTIIISAFLLLRMLSHCLSDDVFHAGLIEYLNKQ